MSAVFVFIDSALRRILGWIFAVPVIFWAVMFIDFLGFSIGTVVWYGPQLLNAPWWAWLFIPDCPLAALYAMVTFYRIRTLKKPDWLTTIAALTCIKYGFWTVLFWGTKWGATGEYLPLEVGLVIVHLAMAGQGILLLPSLATVSYRIRMAVIGWLALSVVADYGFGHHPALAFPITPLQAGIWAALLTTLLALLMLLIYPPNRISVATARSDVRS